MFNYKEIKHLASENKDVSVKDLLALSPQNDPFYVGSKGDVEKARWITEIYEELGKPINVHVRRIHYFIVSRDDICKPNGEPYENTEKDWNFLAQAAKYARYLGLIPTSHFVDRRNPEPINNARYWRNQTIGEAITHIFKAHPMAIRITDGIFPYNPQNALAYHLEIWAEKSTMNDIILPIARNFSANVVTGLGELSITAVYQLIQRASVAQKPVRIFYIADFDPAGENMPISVARKIEFYTRRDETLPEVRLMPLMLTKRQCVEYNLPRTPIKATDKRRGDFEDRHGEGATELDALEALHPGAMKDILNNAIKPYVNIEVYNEVVKECHQIRDAAELQLRKLLEKALEDFDFNYESDWEFPEGELIDESDNWLFDSNRTYDVQLTKYKLYKLHKGDDKDGR